MDNMDNKGGPVIPMGTAPTVFGNASFSQAQSGQAQPLPVSPNQPVQATAPDGITFAELATKKGFKSADDLAKAYTILESHNKKIEMTAADIIKQVYETPAQSVAPVQPAPARADADAIKIVQAMVSDQVKPLKEQLALQQLFLNKPDAKDFATGIASAVKDNPGISWENAYKLAKFDASEQKAQETARVQAQQTQQLKQSVIAGNAAPTQSRGGPDVRSIIRDRSVPFKEVDKIVREYLNHSN